MAEFPTFKGWLWPWPWIGSYCIPSCITRRPLPTYQMSVNSKKLFVDGRTDGRTDEHLRPTLLGQIGRVDLKMSGLWSERWSCTGSQPEGDYMLTLHSARPAVTFPATEHHCPLAGTKLYCLVTEAHRCEQLAQGCYAALLRVGFEPTTCWSQVQRSSSCAAAPKLIKSIVQNPQR